MQSKFTVIRGGKTSDTGTGKYEYKFVSGTSTNTRLMGVIGVELAWTFNDGSENKMLKQVFYLDCESRIVDTYTECVGNDSDELIKARKKLRAALGGRIVPIEEKEARFLVQSYSYGSGSDLGKAGGQHGYTFMLRPEQALTIDEYRPLADRICSELPTQNFAINYYMMRCASLDKRRAAYIEGRLQFRDPENIMPKDQPLDARENIFGITEPVTLCLNKVKTVPDGDGTVTYTCESLTEREDGYTISTADITLSDAPYRVLRAKLTSEFHITDIEAAMMMKRPEYLTVCEILDPDDEFDKVFDTLTETFTETQYESGRLFIDFKNNNDHVGNKFYRINDDMKAVFFLTDNRQLIIMSYSMRDAQYAEYRAIITLLPFNICVTMKYEFAEPVLYEFINSDFEDFGEFLRFITVSNDDGDGDGK